MQNHGGVKIYGVLMEGWILGRDYGLKGYRVGQERGQEGP